MHRVCESSVRSGLDRVFNHGLLSELELCAHSTPNLRREWTDCCVQRAAIIMPAVC